MRQIIEITIPQLIILLTNWNFGAQPATIQYSSTPKINKAGKTLFGNILKLGAVNCIIDFDFAKAVNRRLTKEGKSADFVAQPLWKGKGVHINRRIVQHVDKGTVYLQFKYEKQLKSLHFDSVLNFIPSALLRPYMYKQSAPTNQGVSEGAEIKPRTLKIENIRRIKMKGVTYEVVK